MNAGDLISTEAFALMVKRLYGEDADTLKEQRERYAKLAARFGQSFGGEQGDEIQQYAHQLGARVQPMDDGIAGKVLSQRDILQHGAPPLAAITARANCPGV